MRRLRRPDGSDAGGYRYAGFGGELSNNVAPAIDQPLRWKARWWSDHSRLYDVRARQWSPDIGSFTSIDEFDFHDSMTTLWGWSGQSPLGRPDPSGHFAPPGLPGAVEAALAGETPAATGVLSIPGVALAAVGAGIVVGATGYIVYMVDDYEHPTVYGPGLGVGPITVPCPTSTADPGPDGDAGAPEAGARDASDEGRRITTVIGRMSDLAKFDPDPNVDTWRKSGRIPAPGAPPVTWRENEDWLMDRVNRGDEFGIATDPATLPNPRKIGSYVPGSPNGFFTAREPEKLRSMGIEPRRMY